MMKINTDIFECAVSNLEVADLRAILTKFEISFDGKEKKYQLIEKLIQKIEDKTMPEELYLECYRKAFSEEEDFNEGFYYRFQSDNLVFNYDSFLNSLEAKICDNIKSKYGTNRFKYSYQNMEHDLENKKVTFSLSKEIENRKYDNVKGQVVFYNQRMSVGIEINYEDNTVYIKSKNYNNSNATKFFLEQVLNEIRSDKKGDKVKLSLPKFDNNDINKWAKENNFDITRISAMTLHMIDLLTEFQNIGNNFSGYEMNKVHFGNEIVDTKLKSGLKGRILFGDNIQECNEVCEGILNGQRMNGFEITVNYLYTNEETGVENELVPIPICIVQESTNAFRISSSKDTSCTNAVIVAEIYEHIKNVFVQKLKSKEIRNTENVIEFITNARQVIGEEKGIKTTKKMVL